MSTEKNIRIRQKADTTENWVKNNPILLKNELAIDTKERTIKIGQTDNTRYNSCSYLYHPGDEYVLWQQDGKGRSNGLSPIATALAGDIGLNQNLFAFVNPAYIDIEYSTDGGETWLEYEATGIQKQQLITGAPNANNVNFYIGSFRTNTYQEGTPRATVNDMLRVTIHVSAAGVYGAANKFCIAVSNSSKSMKNWVKVEGQWSDDASETWSLLIDKQQVDGWAGWNSISKFNLLGGAIDEAGKIKSVRFIFGRDTNMDDLVTSTYGYNGALVIRSIRCYGMQYWNTQNPLQRYGGHLYTYDLNKNAVFPSSVKASYFYGTASAASELNKFSYYVTEQLNSGNYVKIAEIQGPGAAFGYYNCMMTVSKSYIGNDQYTRLYSISVHSDKTNSIDLTKIHIGQIAGYYNANTPPLKYSFDADTQTIGIWISQTGQYEKITTSIINENYYKITMTAKNNCTDIIPDDAIDAEYHMAIPSNTTYIPLEASVSASAGTSNKYAREDHVHPKFIDASRGTGVNSVKIGEGTIAVADNQMIVGQYNTEDTDALLAVGNGVDDENRSTAFKVSNSGTYINNDLITDNIRTYGTLNVTASNELDLTGVNKITLTAPEIHLNTTNNDSVYLGDHNEKVATVDQIQQTFIIEDFSNITSFNQDTARVFATVPDNIKLTENSYIMCSACQIINTGSDTGASGTLTHGKIGEWIPVLYQTWNLGTRAYIKIDQDGTIKGYILQRENNNYINGQIGYPLIVTIYPNKPAVSNYNVNNYIPNADLITAKENPTTCIFRNLNIDTTENNILNLTTGTRLGSAWCNALIFQSPILTQPLTIKMYLQLASNSSYSDNFNSIKLQLFKSDGAVYKVDEDTIGTPQLGETRCYTFKNVILSECGDTPTFFYFGFETPVSGSAYLRITGIEIYQDIELNGSYSFNDAEWITTFRPFDKTTFFQDDYSTYYNTISVFYGMSSSYKQMNRQIANTL